MRILRALSCFLGAYLLVTVLAGATTIVYATVNHTAAADAAATSPVLQPSFTATVPYHVLIMLIVFTPFAVLYFRRPRGGDPVGETLRLAVVWAIAAMVADFVGFVAIRNPWSLTPHQMYVDYQPWITLLYIAIFAAPWLRLWGSSTSFPRVWRRSSSSKAAATSSSE